MQVENDSSPSNLTPPARTPVGLFLFCGLGYDTNKAFPLGGRCPEGADEGVAFPRQTVNGWLRQTGPSSGRFTASFPQGGSL